MVETLYALADMFPRNNENGSDGELEAKSWPLPEEENSKLPFEGLILTHVVIPLLLIAFSVEVRYTISFK